MTDLNTNHHGVAQMNPEELRQHIKEARLRRRARNEKPPTRKSSTPRKKKSEKTLTERIGGLSPEEAKLLLEEMLNAKRRAAECERS